ncbi:MAG TPA: transporter substrate-binding domain-containing protein, partial [Verrucomicrobiae bacterium]|nr:transporter substrate-binding domain-containing protein [Verrucomicrobiae bacterium]
EEPDRGAVVVGGDANYPPYEFIDSSGNPAGFNVELTRAIAEVMGMKVEIRLGSWGEMRRGLERGSIDILQGMVSTEERGKRFDFSPPHALVYQTIWTRTGERVRSVADLRGKEVIVMRGSVMHDFLLENDTGAAIVTADSLAAALRILSRGKHDCALLAKLPGQYLVKSLGLTNVEPVAKPLLVQKYGYAARKGEGELLGRFSEGLAILKGSGQFQAIHDRWLGVLEPHPFPWGKILRYGAMIVVPLLLVLAGTVAWSQSLKRRVAERTEELAREVAEKKSALEELRRHQERLVHSDKMAALGTLVSGVAHEVNNPNGLILLNMPRFAEAWRGAVPVLEGHFREHGDFPMGWLNYSRMREEIPGMLEETHQSARKIRRIVEDLKDFARRDSASLTDTVDLNGSVRAALRLVEPALREATDRFQLACDEHLPTFRGNSIRVEQVAVNLLLNACHALEGRDRAIIVSTSAERGRVVLRVRDEGRGVPAEHLPHLTDPFFTTRRE